MRNSPRFVVVACVGLLGTAHSCQTLRGYAETQAELVRNPPAPFKALPLSEQGAALVMHGDFGSLTTDNLQTNAVPWKLLVALSDVVPDPFYGSSDSGWSSRPERPLQRFGLLYDVAVEGASNTASRAGAPVGYAFGTVTRTTPDITLELASSNCSFCHVGRTWDATGSPTETAVWGVPNHSVDIDGLIRAIIAAISDARATDAALLNAMKARFTDLTDAELAAYRRYVLPGFRTAIRDAVKRWGWLHPWKFGGPGFSHGAALLRDLVTDGTSAPAAYPPASVKIPNVYGVTRKKRLLIDGSYVSHHPDQPSQRFVDLLVGFLPVFGSSIERSVAEAPRLPAVREFLAQAKPPRFPGPIDSTKAAAGEPIYREHCASCHGDEKEFPTALISLEHIGTDPTRANSVEPAILAKFNATKIKPFMHLESTGGYVAPSLIGVWAQAPYLHNGSVPTLWALMNPTERPTRFLVGGHALDLVRVGIKLAEPADGASRYPAGYTPWSEPRMFDTTAPGCSNRGHDAMFTKLSATQKSQLLEYLKTL